MNILHPLKSEALYSVLPSGLMLLPLPVCRQAEARQQQFEKSAVGRAALKAVKDAKKQDAREAGGGTARDWLS